VAGVGEEPAHLLLAGLAFVQAGLDLAGIYFAVQASYEQQIVNANAQALTSGVQQYKAAYARELSKLPDLLKTAKASTFPQVSPSRQG
jgi:hypothetical protein